MNTVTKQQCYLRWANGELTNRIYDSIPSYDAAGIYILSTANHYDNNVNQYFIVNVNNKFTPYIACYGSIDDCKKWVVNNGFRPRKYNCYKVSDFTIHGGIPHKVNGIIIDYNMELCFNEFTTNYPSIVDDLSKLDVFTFIVSHINDNAIQAYTNCFGSTCIDLIALKKLDKRTLVYFALSCEKLKGFNVSLYSLIPNYEFQQKFASIKDQKMVIIIDDTDDMVIHPILYKDSLELNTYLQYSCKPNQIIKLITFTLKHRYALIQRDEDDNLILHYQDDDHKFCDRHPIFKGDIYYLLDFMQFKLANDAVYKNKICHQPKSFIKYTLLPENC